MGDAPRGRARTLASAAAGFVIARPRRQKVGAVVVVALLVSAPFGGLRQAPPPAPKAVGIDRPLMIGPFRFTFVKAVTVADLAPTVSPSTPGGRLFVIEAQVSNSGGRPERLNTLTQALTVRGAGISELDGSPATPRAYSVKDGTDLSGGGSMNPGSSYLVALVWDQAPGWTGDRAHLRVGRLEYREHDPLTLSDKTWWLMGDEAAAATFPVERK
jgi:hypothetical protein